MLFKVHLPRGSSPQPANGPTRGRSRLRFLVGTAAAALSAFLPLGATVVPAHADNICYGTSILSSNFVGACESQIESTARPHMTWSPTVGMVGTGAVADLGFAASALGIGSGNQPMAGAGGTTTGGISGTVPTNLQAIPNVTIATASNTNLTINGTADSGGNGYSSGGCTNNGTCSNLQLYWNGSQSYDPQQGGPQVQGSAILSLLDPINYPNDGYFYDFADTLTNFTSYGDYLCGLENLQQASDQRTHVIAYGPTGSTSVGDSTQSQIDVGFSAGGASGKYTATFNTPAGWVEGTMWGAENGNGPTTAGAWNVDQNAECETNPAAIESTSAWRTPTSVGNYNYYFSFGTMIAYQPKNS